MAKDDLGMDQITPESIGAVVPPPDIDEHHVTDGMPDITRDTEAQSPRQEEQQSHIETDTPPVFRDAQMYTERVETPLVENIVDEIDITNEPSGVEQENPGIDVFSSDPDAGSPVKGKTATDDDAPFVAEAERMTAQSPIDNEQADRAEQAETSAEGRLDTEDAQHVDHNEEAPNDAIPDYEVDPADIDFDQIDSYDQTPQEDYVPNEVPAAVEETGATEPAADVLQSAEPEETVVDLPEAELVDTPELPESTESVDSTTDNPPFEATETHDAGEPSQTDLDMLNTGVESFHPDFEGVTEAPVDNESQSDLSDAIGVEDVEKAETFQTPSIDTEEPLPETPQDNEQGNPEDREQSQVVSEGDPTEVNTQPVELREDQVKPDLAESQSGIDNEAPFQGADLPVQETPAVAIDNTDKNQEAIDNKGEKGEKENEGNNGSTLQDTIAATVVDSIQGINDLDMTQNFENLQSMYGDTECTPELFSDEVTRVLEDCGNQLDTDDSTIALQQDSYDAISNDLDQFMEANRLGDVDMDQNLVDSGFDVEDTFDNDTEVENDPVGVEDLYNDY